ncbi:hypothetical protein J1N35_003916 [Gossypium stocksii]|uniref:RNase H type-1 domain-containing protein n=1 Tax=Gossypium stocksii TaxID=47602 RepID=A0A9D4AHV0_9ROSI|nr:hypothetical protein J1N35_003916 [Gossypium stocksii]
MYEGLGLAWDKVGCNVLVESDNALLIEVVKNTYADYNGLVEVRDIKELIKHNRCMRFLHVNISQNMVTDALEKLGCCFSLLQLSSRWCCSNLELGY